MTEIQIYGREGLFHQLTKASKIMNGRYAVLPNGGDINKGNLLSGIELPKGGKYPMVCCMAPFSTLPGSVENQFETFDFTIFFLAKSKVDGDNKLKKPDPSTNTSLHTTPEDWSDMKEVMMGWMNSLEKAGRQLQHYFRLSSKGAWVIGRISHLGNDDVNGVYIRFSASIFDPCEFPDMDESKLENIILPSHPQHFH